LAVVGVCDVDTCATVQAEEEKQTKAAGLIGGRQDSFSF
jgi:hypothetical protein